MIWRAVTFFALLVSVASLAIAIMAYQKAGGDIQQLRHVLQSTRRGTASAIDRVQDFVRGVQQADTEETRKK